MSDDSHIRDAIAEYTAKEMRRRPNANRDDVRRSWEQKAEKIDRQQREKR